MKWLILALFSAVAYAQISCGVIPIRPIGAPANAQPVCTCSGNSCTYLWQALPTATPTSPVQIDSRIPLQVTTPPPIDVLGTYQRALQIQQMQLQNQALAATAQPVPPSEPLPFVGISQIDTTEKLRKALGVTGGATITNVLKDTPASAAGLKKGDVVTQYNGDAVLGAYHLRSLIMASKPNTMATFEVARKGGTVRITVLLGSTK